MKPLLVLRIVVVVLLVSFAGCGETDPVGRRIPVKGKVTVDGKAPDHGSVAFWPDASKGNTSTFECAGSIAADGSYTLSTKGKPGAPPGAYKVTIIVQTKADSTDPTKAVLESPKKFSKKDTTTMTIEVVENAAAGAYDLNFK